MAEGKKKNKWIKAAIKQPGAMTEAAKREGVSNSDYIREHENDKGLAGRRARLAKTFRGMKHKGAGHSLMHKMLGKKKDA